MSEEAKKAAVELLCPVSGWSVELCNCPYGIHKKVKEMEQRNRKPQDSLAQTYIKAYGVEHE